MHVKDTYMESGTSNVQLFYLTSTCDVQEHIGLITHFHLKSNFVMQVPQTRFWWVNGFEWIFKLVCYCKSCRLSVIGCA